MVKSQIKEPKTNKIIDVLRKEYPFERILLGVLGALVLILGVYLVEGKVLEIRLTDWWIFNTELKRTIFAVFVIAIGAVSFVMSIWPFFVPSFGEMKKVTWPNRSTIVNHSARVFGFIFILAGFFILIDVALKPFFIWINGLGV
jgi:preprotein translocase subunit SecE